MLFSSLQFVLFFLGVALVHWFIPRKLRNCWLVLISFYFYSLWGWLFFIPLLISTAVDFSAALAIAHFQKLKNPGRAQVCLWMSVFTNLVLLITCKHFGVFGEHSPSPEHQYQFQSTTYMIPIGISFYTFQTMSYTIDVYRRVLAPTRNIVHFALYVSFFPQILAGPIERAGHLLPQIQKTRTLTTEKLEDGLYLFIWGLFLKSVVADNLAPTVNSYFNTLSAKDGLETLSLLYSGFLQIYCDFAGYSFMAMGLGLALGFELSLNFKTPFFARSPQEFFSRWHITLIDWFRNYLFFPLSRKLSRWLQKSTALWLAEAAVLLVFALWHGLSLRFVLWGAELIVLFQGYRFFRKVMKKRRWQMPRAVSAFFCFNSIIFAGILYRTPNLSDLPLHWRNLSSGIDPSFPLAFFEFLVFATLVFSVEVFHYRKDQKFFFKAWPRVWRFGWVLLVYFLIVTIGAVRSWDFIYFEF